MKEDRNRWNLRIKDLRIKHQTSLLEAERIALSLPEWRRWVGKQINHDNKCRRMAYRHIRDNGKNALIKEVEGQLRVR